MHDYAQNAASLVKTLFHRYVSAGKRKVIPTFILNADMLTYRQKLFQSLISTLLLLLFSLATQISLIQIMLLFSSMFFILHTRNKTISLI
jgi:hypothetical protein